MKFTTNGFSREDVKWEKAMKEVDLWALDEAWDVISNAVLSKSGKNDREKADAFFQDLLDSDNSSHCDEDELFEGLRSCGVQISVRQMHVLFRSIDEDDSKYIETKEFHDAYEKQKARVGKLKEHEFAIKRASRLIPEKQLSGTQKSVSVL